MVAACVGTSANSARRPNDIAAPMRRNETRSLSLMSAIQVDSATAQSGGRSPDERSDIRDWLPNVPHPHVAALMRATCSLIVAIARKAVAVVGICTCGTYSLPDRKWRSPDGAQRNPG